MNLKSKVFQPLLLSGFISIMGVGSTAQAQVSDDLPRCLRDFGYQYNRAISGFEHEQMSRLEMAAHNSVTGVFLSLLAVKMMNGSGSTVGGPAATMSGVGLTFLGLAAVLGAQYATTDEEDVLRAFRRTRSYNCLSLEMGRNRTEELLADLVAGWPTDRLAEKYLTPEELAIFRQYFS